MRNGWLLTLLGRNSDGLSAQQRAIELDPLDAIARAAYGRALRLAHRDVDAETAYLRSSEMDPNLSFPLSELVYLYVRLGRLEEALDSAKKVSDLVQTKNSKSNVKLLSAAIEGPEALREIVSDAEKNDYAEFSAELLPSLYFAVGKAERALEFPSGSGSSATPFYRRTRWGS